MLSAVVTEPRDSAGTSERRSDEDAGGEGEPSRRQLLRAGAVLAGVAVAGGGYLLGTAGGDDGDYTAPADFPLVSTRGHFTTHVLGDVALADGHGRTEVDTVGDWTGDDAADGEVCIFVHGLNVPDRGAASDRAYTARRGLERLGYDQPVVGYSWQSDPGVWWTPVELAHRNGAKLAHWAGSRFEATGAPIRVIAHSLGAPVVLAALAALEAREPAGGWASWPVRSVALLGGAVEATAPAAPEYADAIARVPGGVHNFHKRDDKILRRVSLVEGHKQLGRAGFPDSGVAPEAFRDHDVTDSVRDHNSYYEPDEGCLPGIVEAL